MEIEKNICVAFTGHRCYRGEADALLRREVERLYAEGYRCFITGMSWGFDLAAGLAVAEAKRLHDDIRLVAAEPFAGFRDMFDGRSAEDYDAVLAAADERVCVCDAKSARSYMLRNDFMVDNSSFLVAWYDGSPHGGTAYTVKRARRMRLPITNLRPSPQLELFG